MPSLLSRCTTCIAMLLLMCGCATHSAGSNGQSSYLAPLTERAAFRPSADPVTAVFVSTYNGVSMFDATGKQTGSITDVVQPRGIAVDASGNLWVADEGSYDVRMYPPPYTKATFVLHDPDGHPSGVAVDTRSGPYLGYVAVFTGFTTTGGYSSTSLYKSGATKPCKTLGGRLGGGGIDGSFDARDNIVVFSWGKHVVGLWKGGCSAKNVERLTVSNTLQSPSDAFAAPGGGLAIMDENASGGGGTLYSYSAPVNGSLGMPVYSTPVVPGGLPVGFAFSSAGHEMWVVDYAAKSVTKYSYPGGAELQTFSVQYPEGEVAAAPALVP